MPRDAGALDAAWRVFRLWAGREGGGTFVKQPSVIEQKAYRDTWGRGLDGYLNWFYDTTVLLRELLAD